MTYKRIDCGDCQTHSEREHYVGYKVKQKWSPNSPFCAECTLGQLRTAEGEIANKNNIIDNLTATKDNWREQCDRANGQITALKSELEKVNGENGRLKDAISNAAVESMVDGQGQFCRYCLETLDEYYQGHKPDCIYLICSNIKKRP